MKEIMKDYWNDHKALRVTSYIVGAFFALSIVGSFMTDPSETEQTTTTTEQAVEIAEPATTIKPTTTTTTVAPTTTTSTTSTTIVQFDPASLAASAAVSAWEITPDTDKVLICDLWLTLPALAEATFLEGSVDSPVSPAIMWDAFETVLVLNCLDYI